MFNGRSDPLDTGTLVMLHKSNKPRLLRQTCCTGTFPAVEAMPTNSASLLANKYTSAIASSTPVSTSAKMGSGAPCSPATVIPSRYGRVDTPACLDWDLQPITQTLCGET